MSAPTDDRPPADDAEVMRIWRECGLPEWFLGNGGSNYRLSEFARRIRDEPRLPPSFVPVPGFLTGKPR